MQRSALCRSRRELSNEYLLAKIGVDTAENEPLEVWGKIQFTIHFAPRSLRVLGEEKKKRMQSVLVIQTAGDDGVQPHAGLLGGVDLSQLEEPAREAEPAEDAEECAPISKISWYKN